MPSKIISEILPPIRLYESEDDHRAYTEADLPDARVEMQRVVVKRMQAAMDRLAAARRYPVLG